MKTKAESKTIWLASIQFAIGVAVLVGQTFPDWAGYALLVKSLLDVFLRTITKEAIM